MEKYYYFFFFHFFVVCKIEKNLAPFPVSPRQNINDNNNKKKNIF